MAEPSYRALRLSMYAIINGQRFDDLVQFSSTFELNTIPGAAISIAVGTDVKSKLAATIHRLFSSMKILLPAKVYLNWTEAAKQHALTSDDLQGNKSDLLIFDGYAMGIGWQRSTNGASCTIYLQHWLVDLEYSSALSASSHPANPADWTYSANFRQSHYGGSGNASETAANKPGWVPYPGPAKLITRDDLTTDLWDNVVKKWMVGAATACSADPIDRRAGGRSIEGTRDNAAALNALARMKSKPPLAMKLPAMSDATVLPEAIHMALARGGWAAWATATLWGKLVGDWCPTFLMSVAPCIGSAYVTPFCGGLRVTDPTKIKTITTGEYSQCELSSHLPRVLRLVGCIHPVAFQTGLNPEAAGGPVNYEGLAGCYPDHPTNVGMTMLKNAPGWLCNQQLHFHNVAAVVGNINSADTGMGLGGTGANVPSPRSPAETVKAVGTLCDQFCHHWYALEMLKGRVGELSGKLRLDICPGSQVRIELGTSNQLADDQLALPLLATVMRVSTVINSEMQRAGTAFSLAHLRTEKENADDRFGSATPPLYTAPFFGSALTD